MRSVDEFPDDGHDRGDQQQGHRDVEGLAMQRIFEEALQTGTEYQPGTGTGKGDHAEAYADNGNLEKETVVQRGVGGERAATHYPGLGIDPFKCGRLPEADRPGR